jgi:hypothetical protein
LVKCAPSVLTISLFRVQDTLVPRKYEDDPRLAAWVETQRALWNRDYRETNISHPLPLPDDADAPAVVDLSLNPAAWDLGMAEDAIDAVDTGIRYEYDHLDATEASEVEKDYSLLPPKRLSQDRKDKLDAIGFVWSLRNKRVEDHWDTMFHQVCVQVLSLDIYRLLFNS